MLISMKEDLMEANDLKPKDEEFVEKIPEENKKKENVETTKTDKKEEKADLKEEKLEEKELRKDKTSSVTEGESKEVEKEETSEKEEIQKTDKNKEVEQQNEKKEETKQNQKKKKQDKGKKNKKEQPTDKQNKDSKKNVKDSKAKTKKLKKIVISIIIVALVALLFSTVFALTNINNEKIISGVTIKGIEVSGLSKEEAIAKLETTYTAKLENNIMLQYEDFESELNPTLMEVNYNIEEAVDEAYSIGRTGNIFVNNYNILGTLIGKRDINVDVSK